MLPEIWNMTDIIFCHLGPFFALLPCYWSQILKFGINVKISWRYYPITHVYHKWRLHDVQFLKYKAQQSFLSFWAICCPLTLLTTWKIKVFRKWKKKSWRYYNFTLAYHKWWSYDVWFLRYGVRQTEFFSPFGPFFALLPPKQPRKSKFWKNEKSTWRYHHFTKVYHKWQSYDVWFLRYEVRETEFFVIFGHFLPFYPINNPKTQNFQKMKKAAGDTILLHKCTKNPDHKLYCSWDMTFNRRNYFSVWVIFCPFTPLPTQKIKKKIKK